MSAEPIRWLLLPGLDGSGRLFRGFLECLRGVDAVVVDYPDEIDWSLDDYASHAAKAVGVAQRCIVIAESFSGSVALRLQRRDSRIAAVVLVASFVRCPNPLLRVLPPAALAVMAKVAAVRASLRIFCLGLDAPKNQVEELAATVRALPTAVLLARLAILRTLDERQTLRSACVPVLHLRASRDRLVWVNLVEDQPRSVLFRQLPIDGPHFLLQACPQPCRSAIDEWLGGEGADICQGMAK